ncbi:MAG: argininosuccinate lyase [Abditibacteriota bacterium]|nr:argininosuccinate lyase [Abditibacteriota bacterium]
MHNQKLWGGRFSKQTAKLMDEFSESISFDYKLAEADIKGSIAHARMLARCGIISEEDSGKIIKGLSSIIEDIRSGNIEFDPSAEDIHMNVEQLLKQRIGEAAGRLHTARSRNDQVATDIRLFLKDALKETVSLIRELQAHIIRLAEDNFDIIMPGFTHTQHAQPVLLSHELMAYFWMLLRDRGRFEDCLKRFDLLPLGSGALAGTTFPIDRHMTAQELGFSGITDNSIDSVSDRDFISEFLADASILMTHLSRFSEEIIFWNSSEFGWIILDDEVTTGSSIMPQKKNPDAAELVRGKTARVYGALMSLLTLQKGLLLSYNRDLQEDKEPLFDAVHTIQMCLKIFALMLKGAAFNGEKMAREAGKGFSVATDLADYLVRKDLPFREAHAQVGSLVAYAAAGGRELSDLSFEEIKARLPLAEEDIMQYLSSEASVRARKAPGGTAPSAVREQIDKAKALL